MRNQYKILTEKYNTVKESGEDNRYKYDLPVAITNGPLSDVDKELIIKYRKDFRKWMFTQEGMPELIDMNYSLLDLEEVKVHQLFNNPDGVVKKDIYAEVNGWFIEKAREYLKHHIKPIRKALTKHTKTHGVDLRDL